MKNRLGFAVLAASFLGLAACGGVSTQPRDTTATGSLIQQRNDKDNVHVGMVDDDGQTTSHTAASSRTRGRTQTRSSRASAERPPRGPHQ